MFPAGISLQAERSGFFAMNILLTGIAGFIGSKTAQFLLDEGHTVFGLDNLNDYYDPRIKHHRLGWLAKQAGADAEVLQSLTRRERESGHSQLSGFIADRLEYRTMEVNDLAGLLTWLGDRRIDAVINLAARAGVRYSMENPHVYLETNTDGTLKLLELMHQLNIPKLVLASTSSLYAGQPTPFVETLPVNTPISPYAATKKAAEVMAYTYHHLYGIDVSVLRYFTVFGPAGRPDMAPYRFVKWIAEGTPIQLFGDGEQSRDFTYVDDIARGTLAALKSVGYSIFNLGGGNEPVSINTTIAWLEEYLGKKARIDYHPFHKADMQETFANIEKAQSELGWNPQIGVRDGFHRTAQWYLDHQDWLRGIPV
jgi:UDP-glucuronate 4-epimerase